MLKILGWLFIIGGLLFCLTIIFIGWGLPLIAVGALLLIASGSMRKKERNTSEM